MRFKKVYLTARVPRRRALSPPRETETPGSRVPDQSAPPAAARARPAQGAWPRARRAPRARAQPKQVKMTARERDAVSENALIATAL